MTDQQLAKAIAALQAYRKVLMRRIATLRARMKKRPKKNA
jgi:hypothetical protein